MTIPRFITGDFASSPKGEPLLLAIVTAAKFALEVPGRKVLLVFATEGVLGNVGWALAPGLGAAVYDRLVKDGAANTSPPLARTTLRLMNHLFSWDGPVVMVFPDQKMWEAVSKLRGVTAEIVVPHTPGGAAVWQQAWTPSPLGSAPATPTASTLDPVVMQALKSLSTLVNFNNGMVNREKNDTIRVFKSIVANRPKLDADAIVPVLIGKFGWPPKMAADAGEVYSKIKAGRRFPGEPDIDPAAFARWEERARTQGV